MLESQLEDALGAPVKTLDTVETVHTVKTVVALKIEDLKKDHFLTRSVSCNNLKARDASASKNAY